MPRDQLADGGDELARDSDQGLIRGVPSVVPIRSSVDLETLGLSHNPCFIEILNRSWESYKKKGGISFTEMRKRRGLSRRRAPRPARRAQAAPRR